MSKKKPKKKAFDYARALKLHENRNLRSRKTDEAKTSRIVHKGFNKSWYKNPSKSDIRHIDTKKKKATNIHEVSSFIKGVYPELTMVRGTKSMVRLKNPIKSKRDKLQKVANIRFSNVIVKKRKAKNTKNDYRILIKK